MITKKELEGLAHLSYLTLTEEEKERLLKEMTDIIAFANTVNGSVAGASAPAEEAINYTDLREDEVVPSFGNDEILSGVEGENGFFAVRRSSVK